jgi:hypothetical protein
MKRQIIFILLICWISSMIAVQPATAASFDLLLKGHWAYADLLLLADAHLLRGYDNGQELAVVFPLTRYEVALLVEEVLFLHDDWDEQNNISADTLMWEILKGKVMNGKVELSTEVVAQARRDSEGAYEALTRLTKEFTNELGVLGVSGTEGLLSFTQKVVMGDPAPVPVAKVSKISGDLHARTLACLGATQLLGINSSSAATNGYTLSSSLAIEVRPLGVNLWQSYNTAVRPRGLQATSPFPVKDNVMEDTYAPVEVTALVEYSVEEPYQAPQASRKSQAKSEGASLRLYPDMTDKRPMGLLTSYFLGRMSD